MSSEVEALRSEVEMLRQDVVADEAMLLRSICVVVLNAFCRRELRSNQLRSLGG